MQTAALSPANQSLLNEIAHMYSDANVIIQENQRYLAGVPEQIQRRVLEDWNADLMSLSQDPDPGTSIYTTMDQRIIRQLSRAGIPLEQLDRDLQVRLSAALSSSGSGR